MKQGILESSLFIAIALVACALFFYDVELYGDVFQFLALYLGIVILLYERDIKRCIILAIAAAAVLGVVYGIKLGFSWIAQHYSEYAQISLRPYAFERVSKSDVFVATDYTGFPSGHTAAAFIAVGFALHFYPKRWVLLLAFLAILVPPSRVITLWHTITQVIAGGLLSLLISYFVVYWLQKFWFFREKR